MDMALEAKELEQIGEYVQSHLDEWLAARPPVTEGIRYTFALGERMVRVEEELKTQRELMKQGFDMMDKRFEQVDKRFEQVDKRFEEITTRLERLSTRMFHFMIWSFGFTATAAGIIIGVIKLL